MSAPTPKPQERGGSQLNEWQVGCVWAIPSLLANQKSWLERGHGGGKRESFPWQETSPGI